MKTKDPKLLNNSLTCNGCCFESSEYLGHQMMVIFQEAVRLLEEGFELEKVCC